MTERRLGAPIGLRLRELRVRLGWSQDALAERSGLRRTEISVIERGGNKGGSWRVRMWLARGFGVPFETLNAYWGAELGLDEIVAGIEAKGSTPASAADAEPSALPASRHARPLARPNASPPEYFLLFPNLDLATRLLTRDSGLGSDVVRHAAVRAAIEYGADEDRETLQWVRVLEWELGKTRSTTRVRPRSIPNLATAIRLVAADRGLDEDLVAEAAARRMHGPDDPSVLTAVQWIRVLDDEFARLGDQAPRPEKRALKARATKP